MQVSLLLEGLILGQPRQAERRHLDPMRHMVPDTGPSSPAEDAAPPQDGAAAGVDTGDSNGRMDEAGPAGARVSVQLPTLSPAPAT